MIFFVCFIYLLFHFFLLRQDRMFMNSPPLQNLIISISLLFPGCNSSFPHSSRTPTSPLTSHQPNKSVGETIVVGHWWCQPKVPIKMTVKREAMGTQKGSKSSWQDTIWSRRLTALLPAQRGLRNMNWKGLWSCVLPAGEQDPYGMQVSS